MKCWGKIWNRRRKTLTEMSTLTLAEGLETIVKIKYKEQIQRPDGIRISDDEEENNYDLFTDFTKDTLKN